MSPQHDQLVVRILQVRDQPRVLAEEHASVCKRTRLRPEQLLSTSVLTDTLEESLLEGIDAVIIGGAGAHSVTQTYPWTEALLVLCVACARRSLPLFGSCWGHQFLARAFGGEVVHDPHRAEMGTHAVTLTEEGRRDPLFSGAPASFEVQMGHHDRVTMLPPGAVELARNDTAPFQAFRLADLPIYGTQFHSELDAEELRGRMYAYRSHYPELAGDGAFRAALDGIRPTPHADVLLHAFLTEFALPKARRR